MTIIAGGMAIITNLGTLSTPLPVRLNDHPVRPEEARPCRLEGQHIIKLKYLRYSLWHYTKKITEIYIKFNPHMDIVKKNF
jgi:hypothetical protein